MASSRVICWSLTLSAYSYKICYWPGKQQANVDAQSCLPLLDGPSSVAEPAETVLLLNELSCSSTLAADIRSWTAKDTTLAQVLQATLREWCDGKPKNSELDRCNKLSAVDGCILWGSRAKVGRREGNRNFTWDSPRNCKDEDRNYVWWPKIDEQLELKVRCVSVTRRIPK